MNGNKILISCLKCIAAERVYLVEAGFTNNRFEAARNIVVYGSLEGKAG